MSSKSFDGIPEKLRAGDEAAAREVFSRFTKRLIGLARSRLDEKLRRKTDPDDVVQSVYRSFFHRQRAEQFELADWDGLWALLARITVRKCCRQAEVQQAARRDVRREVGFHGASDSSSVQWEAPSREPTPDEVAALDDTLSQLLSELDEQKRDMLVLRLQGYTVEEVSQYVGRTERSVYRLLSRVRDRIIELDSCSPPRSAGEGLGEGPAVYQ